MLEKCVAPLNNAFADNFHSEEVVICGVNIKPYKCKEIVKPMIPDKTITSWGVFLHLRLSNGDQFDAVWKLDKTVVSECNDVPCIAKMKKEKKNKSRKGYIQESPIPIILRAVGVNELVELIDTKVRMKPLNESFPVGNGFGISPINEESGRWFYPDYFEIHTLSLESDDCKPDHRSSFADRLKSIPANMEYPDSVEDKDLRDAIIDNLVKNCRDVDGDFVELNDERYFVHATKGVIAILYDTSGKEDTTDNGDTIITSLDKLNLLLDGIYKYHEGYISHLEQDQFKYEFTMLYNDYFTADVKIKRIYGIDKINKFMKMQGINYKLKIVYAHNDIPRHWLLIKFNWDNESK